MKKKRTTAKKSPAGKKRAARKRPAKKTARKRVARKTTGKRAASGQATRKSAAKRVTGSKAGRKATAAKPRTRSAPKRTAGKKPAAGRTPARASSIFPRAAILKFEQELLAEKHRILKQGDFADEMMDTTSDGAVGNTRREYDAENGSENYRRELASRLKSIESETLRQIDAALRRINQGTYGICERCGRRIPKARLDVVPHARICMRCVRGEPVE